MNVDTGSATVATAPRVAVSGPFARARGQLRRSVVASSGGPVPVIVGAVLVWLFFQSRNSQFLSARNLSNLSIQIAVIGLLSMGAALVIIGGQFDISLGAELGVSAAILAVLLQHHWPVWTAVLATFLFGALFSVVQGFISVYAGVPSFIVTLGGFLALTGVQLQMIGNLGAVPINSSFIIGVSNNFVPKSACWLVIAVVAAILLVSQVQRRRAWLEVALEPPPMRRLVSVVVLPVAFLSLLLIYFSSNFGIPVILFLLLTLTAAIDWLTQRTAFGKHLYAVGGNVEAARRAGLPVRRITLTTFALAGLLVAFGGIASASQLYSVSADVGAGNLLLQAVAGAVIGGVSLFGGRGRVYAALLGSLLIVSISNGLALLGESAATSYEATGVILVLAVTLDALSRKRQAGS